MLASCDAKIVRTLFYCIFLDFLHLRLFVKISKNLNRQRSDFIALDRYKLQKSEIDVENISIMCQVKYHKVYVIKCII